MSFQDHFSAQAARYAQARPDYPADLFVFLAKIAPARQRAWDAGAGNGQASVALAEHFQEVIATEPSGAQLASAMPHPRVHYHQSAEIAPMLAEASVDLVTVAQAAHWFDRPKFYDEVRRVLRPGGVLALWTYALCQIAPEIDSVVLRFYSETVGPYWPPERRHTENGYAEFGFPFAELSFPAFAMERDWTRAAFTAYLRTWSSVNRFLKAHGRDPVDELERDLARVWPDDESRIVRWPLRGRVGRHSK